MYCCEGKYCIKRSTCQRHLKADNYYPYDYSNASEPIDKITCACKYYKNSIGSLYADKCVKCDYNRLCLEYLGWLGDITMEGWGGIPLSLRCAEIRADPEKIQKKIDDKRSISFRKNTNASLYRSNSRKENNEYYKADKQIPRRKRLLD